MAQVNGLLIFTSSIAFDSHVLNYPAGCAFPKIGNPGVLSIVFTTTRVAQQPLRAS